MQHLPPIIAEALAPFAPPAQRWPQPDFAAALPKFQKLTSSLADCRRKYGPLGAARLCRQRADRFQERLTLAANGDEEQLDSMLAAGIDSLDVENAIEWLTRTADELEASVFGGAA